MITYLVSSNVCEAFGDGQQFTQYREKLLFSSHLIDKKPTWNVGIPVPSSGQANHVVGLNLHLIIRCCTYC